MDHGKNDDTNSGSGDGTLGTNRLARETSPYLLQHRHNPVDWYPWGEEAFERARREDKPILLSVGYSACHWCHVMAHESFENESIASLMNRNFVNVKVDREERPDVDAVYMSAVQAMTGSGGWPMTVVMTPDGEPFFAGTYFPPEDRYGRPGFPRLLQSLAHAWSQRREEVLESAGSVREHLLRINRPAVGGSPAVGGGAPGREASLAILDAALETLESSFDPRHGGFGGAPKFPPHGALRFLLLQDDERAWRMADLTLERMARGGIYDQLGGGFARYSVDERWLVPHFEKMLYDNAQLVQRYTEAYRRSGRDLHRRVVEETLAWVAREMTSPDGGFYSALDADSEGEEGRFYLWEQSEIRALLGDDAELFAVAYGVGAVGNFEGRTVLEAVADADALAARFGLAEAEVEARLARARTTLFEAREARVRPGLDDKILTSWNGLMLAAYADAGRVLQREDYLDAARRNAAFVRETLYRGGRLRHSFRAGEAKVAGLLEDYAYFGLGLLTLYRATFEREWLDFALELAAVVPLHFADADGGGFFSTPDDGEALLVRPKDYIDSATPGTNGAAAELLVHVARITGEHALEELAAGAVAPMAEPMRKQPNAFGSLMVTLAFLLSPPREVALVGDLGAADTRALRAVLDEHALPFTVLAHSRGPDDPLAERLPFLRARGRVEGRATAYVCEGGACRLPVVTPAALAEQLAEAGV